MNIEFGYGLFGSFRTNALICLAAVSAISAGCNGSSSKTPVNTDYSSIKVADAQDSVLKPAAESDLTLLLKNGIRYELRNPVFVAVAPTADGSTTGTHSDTTVQVPGVDEADVMKFDGRYIYALAPDPAATPLPVEPGGGAAAIFPSPPLSLKVIRTDATTAQMDTISRFELPTDQTAHAGLYRLTQANSDTTQYIVALTQSNQSVYAASSGPARIFPPQSHFVVDLLDVSTPTAVSKAWNLEIEGYLRTSRQIGDTLYLVSSFTPMLSALNYSAATQAERESNERLILSTPLDALLPRVWIAGAEGALIRPDNCFVPLNTASNDAYRELTIVTAINLRERLITDAKCLNVGESGVYVSTETMYFGGTILRDGALSTVLHKFAMSNGQIAYRATGAVPGMISWTNSSYFMDEYRNDLRIVTTSTAALSVFNRLSVLREVAGGRLQVVASLPNADHPETIGAPQEQIRAVRFAQNRGYIVTARAIDPLYVLNLDDGTNPYITGSLHIPGFSTFLLPFGTDYLFGVGQATDNAGLTNGVKVELYDVSDMANPRSIGAYTFGRTWSEALWDPHALTTLTLSEPTTRQRIALHLDVFNTPQFINGTQSYSWTYSGLHLFEISGLETHAPDFQFQGVLKADAAATSFHPPLVRSALEGDGVFYLFGEKNISALWQNISMP